MDRTALIIDDSHTCQSILRKQLETLSFAVTCKETGPECLAHLKSNSVDIVFLDETLAEENGLNVLAQIKNADPEQVVVMYTAQNDSDYAQLAKQKGAISVLNKQVRAEGLQNLLTLIDAKANTVTQKNKPKAAPATLKSVVPLANIDPSKLNANAENTAKHQPEDDLTAIFSRARYDHLKHQLEVLDDRRQTDAKRFKILLALTALPILFLLAQTFLQKPQTDLTGGANLFSEEQVKSLKYEIAKQDQSIDLISQQLKEQQHFLDALQTRFSSVDSSQQALADQLSKTQRLVDDVKIDVNSTRSLIDDAKEKEIEANSEPEVKKVTRGVIDQLMDGETHNEDESDAY